MTGRESGPLPLPDTRRVDCALARHRLRRGWKGLALFAVMLLAGIA